MEDTQELREAFSDWIRENKTKQYQLKKLIEQYEFGVLNGYLLAESTMI